MSARPGRSGAGGLTARLLLAQLVVVIAAAVAAGIAAVLAGPRLFHAHMVQAGAAENSTEFVHAQMAFETASTLTLALAVVVAILAAGAVSWFVGQRLTAPLDTLTAAAREISRSHYAVRVPALGAGAELATLGTAFNDLAERLGDVESTRRRLLSDLAHEIRTPVATLAAYHEGLLDGVIPLGPETHRVLTDQTTRLSRLAADLAEVSSAEEGRITLARRPQLVTDILGAAQRALEGQFAAKGVTLSVAAPADTGVVVTADPHRLAQVLTNLLTNALRHTPTGGTVRVSAALDGSEVVVTVADTGSGIPADDLPHVFERFYRGDASRSRDGSGSGIGLTIAKSIVDAHGGTIEARSDGPGRGATFLVYLPMGETRGNGSRSDVSE